MSSEEDKFGALREAATKLLACQIHQLPCREGDRGFHIWTQGVIVQIVDNGNQVTIDDGTGLVIIMGLHALITGESWLELGKYVMITGHVMHAPSTEGDAASVMTTKIADLSADANCEVLWWLEVMDIQLRLGDASADY
eukprot:scpid83410/ scgid24429/ 